MTDNQQRAAEVWDRIGGGCTAFYSQGVIAAALDEAEQRGRRSVGLGDNPCGDEYRPRMPHLVLVKSVVLCTLRSGHDGLHEHEASGMTWSTR